MPQYYLVKWEIEVDAESPVEAAKKALAIQRDPDSMATVFEVQDGWREGMRVEVKVDLSEQEERN